MRWMAMVVAALVLSNVAKAADGMRMGGEVLVGAASMAGNDGDYYDYVILGPGLGFTLEVPLADAASIRTGLGWCTKGGKAMPESCLDITLTIQALEVPVLAKFDLAGGRCYATAGLTFGFVIHAEEWTVDDTGPSHSSVTVDVTEELDSLDVCLALGAGGSFAMGGGTMSVGLRYSMGLSSLNADTDIKTSTVALVFGYTH
jgi:hypothetical protein